MGNLTTDPDGYSPNDIVSRLHRCLETGIYGIDYTIIARDKNEALIEGYIVSESDRIDILKRLSIDDYDGWEISNSADFPKDIIHFFHYSVHLLPRGRENASAILVRLYIKMTWTREGNALFVISFHE